MNTKKIMALTLAALMAAGSTSTVFAATGNELTFDNGKVLYGEDDGILVKDADNEFAPGDTIYLQLNVNGDPEESDINRLNVYADWKVGGSNVESVDIVYKKGEASTGDVVNYTVKVGDKTLTVTEKTAAAVEAAVLAEMKKDPNFLKDERAAALTAGKKESGYVISGVWTDAGYETKTDGFKVGTKYYEATEAATYAGEFFTVDGTAKTFYLHTEDSSKDIGRASFTRGDGSEYSSTEVSSASDYTLSGSEGNVYFVKTAHKGSVTEDELLALGVVEDITGDTIVKTDDKTITEGEIVSSEKPAYVIADTTYTDATEAGKAADAAVAKEVGEKVVPSVFAVNVDTSIDANYKAGYTYWVESKTKDSDTTKSLDVAGTLYIGTSKNKAEDGTNKTGVDFVLSNQNDDYYNPAIEDEATIEPDANGAVKFADDAEEVTIYFGNNEDAWYTFNAKGQSAVNFAYTMKFNSEIADLFPKANIDFITWTATPATNRTGDLYITADEDTFLYEVTEDGIKEVNGAKYDEDEGAWHIRTRKLASYVISDMELDTSVKLDNDSSSSTSSGSNTDADGNKTNPDTGR